MKCIYLTIILKVMVCLKGSAQKIIPNVYSNIYYDSVLFIKSDSILAIQKIDTTSFTYDNALGIISGNENGLDFNFLMPHLNGTLYYGFINDQLPPYSSLYHRKSSIIDDGAASINILKNLSDKYDIINWQEKNYGTLAYRIANDRGNLLYEGKVSFLYSDTIFNVDTTIIEGPFINQLTKNTVVISYRTNFRTETRVLVNRKYLYHKHVKTKMHEILIDKLKPGTKYTYQLLCERNAKNFYFETEPEYKKEEFSFAFICDSQSGMGGGERDFYGTNYYSMRKLIPVCKYYNVKFIQFSGDMIDGYSNNIGKTNLQYANWKRSVEPIWHYLPIYTTMGNHEAVNYIFQDNSTKRTFWLDKFPFDSCSGEKIFADNFSNFPSKLVSEDKKEKSIGHAGFPKYNETVYYYTFGNIAVVVLNTEYFYSSWPTLPEITSGNVHGYIMDNQLQWLESTIEHLDSIKSIDHIFITHHSPVFPVSGSISDAMWYNGNNYMRPYISGIPVKKGIIERRDEYLDIIINNSNKVKAVLCGDEHNYSFLEICDKMPRYGKDKTLKGLKLSRTITQIINGGGGGSVNGGLADVPWKDHVIFHQPTSAVVILTIKKKTIKIKTIDLEDLETIHEYTIN